MSHTVYVRTFGIWAPYASNVTPPFHFVPPYGQRQWTIGATMPDGTVLFPNSTVPGGHYGLYTNVF